MARSEQGKAQARVYARERRKWLYDRGFCIDCGSAWVVPGHVRCPACANSKRMGEKRRDPTGEIARARANQLAADRAAAGVCTKCGGPLDKPGKFTRCAVCREKRAAYMRTVRIKRRFEREAQAARERSRP